MRQSPQPSRELFVFVSFAGSEKEAELLTLVVGARLPCVCAASTVVP